MNRKILNLSGIELSDFFDFQNKESQSNLEGVTTYFLSRMKGSVLELLKEKSSLETLSLKLVPSGKITKNLPFSNT